MVEARRIVSAGVFRWTAWWNSVGGRRIADRSRWHTGELSDRGAWIAECSAILAYCVAVAYTLVRIARQRMLWFDEWFTLELSRSPGELWGRLAAGVDLNPPLIYLLTTPCIAVFGEAEWAVRLPSIAAAILGHLCLYAFVRHRWGWPAGLVAITSLSISPIVWTYFVEARPYALMLGFTASALLAWQLAGEGRRGAGWAFSLSVSLGLLSHYYFVVPLVAFACAELVRSLEQRRVNRSILLGFVVAAATLAALYPLWGFAPAAYKPGFWSKVQLKWETMIDTLYQFHAKELTGPLAVSLMLAVLGRRSKPVPEPDGSWAERIVLVGLALGPAIGVAIGAKLTGGFTFRYVVPSMLGLAALWGIVVTRGVSPGIGGLIAGSFVIFGLVGNGKFYRECFRVEAREIRDVTATLPSGPTLIYESAFDFARAQMYFPPVSAAYVADLAIVRKHSPSDTIERGLRALATVRPMRLFTIEDVLARLRAGEPLYSFGPGTSWAMNELRTRGVTLMPVASHPRGNLHRLMLNE